ncbi:MAG: hypothetical protein WBD56_12560 [Anaerolineales bacterium]
MDDNFSTELSRLVEQVGIKGQVAFAGQLPHLCFMGRRVIVFGSTPMRSAQAATSALKISLGTLCSNNGGRLYLSMLMHHLQHDQPPS